MISAFEKGHTALKEGDVLYAAKMFNEAENDNANVNEDNYERQLTPTETFTLQNRVGEYAVATTMHEKYAQRPEKLKGICLAQFSIAYDNGVIPKETKMANNASVLYGSMTLYRCKIELPKFIVLDNEKSTSMKLRTMPKVLRIHKSSNKKSYEELYAELLLFFPWQSEVDLFSDDEEKCIELFNKSKEIIRSLLL